MAHDQWLCCQRTHVHTPHTVCVCGTHIYTQLGSVTTLDGRCLAGCIACVHTHPCHSPSHPTLLGELQHHRCCLTRSPPDSWRSRLADSTGDWYWGPPAASAPREGPNPTGEGEGECDTTHAWSSQHTWRDATGAAAGAGVGLRTNAVSNVLGKSSATAVSRAGQFGRLQCHCSTCIHLAARTT